MSPNEVETAILICLICVVGCTRGEPERDASAGDDSIERSSIENPYVQCEEELAEQVLLVSVTIPGLLEKQPFRIPFGKAERDVEFFGGGGSSINADGPDGGLNAFIGIESSTVTSLTVRIDLIWSKGQKRGELNERIDVPIGEPGARDLPEAQKIEWRFVEPSREVPD